MKHNQVQATSVWSYPSRKQRKSIYILTVLILTIVRASLLRLYNLGERSFWYDEVASVRNVKIILKLPPYENGGYFDFFRLERLSPLRKQRFLNSGN